MWPPQDQALLYLKRGSVTPCNQNMHGYVAVIGSGMAGLKEILEIKNE